MKTLLVDNYDSYTYNVFHLLAAVSGEEPIVVHNDMVSWRALSRWDFDAVVLSPGPGRPERWHDFGVCADILRSSEIPVLGVCLGHQGLGHVLSGMVASAPMAMHGRLSRVQHLGSGLFAGIPQDFAVVRYHSLAVSGPLGPEGRVTAWTSDGVVMGIEHRRRPMWGVQFHPESIATEHGLALVENFYALARHRRAPRAALARRPPASPPRRTRTQREQGARQVKLRVRTIAGEPCTERVFGALFGSAREAFWLDSTDAPTPLAQCSYMGTSAGAERCVLEYNIGAGRVQLHGAHGSQTEYRSIFDVLDRELAARRLTSVPEQLRGLLGGFVGYLGYECKADCGSPDVHRSDLPDALLLYANRLVAVDHVQHLTHVLALCEEDDLDADHWLEDAERVVRATLASEPTGARPPADAPHAAAPSANAPAGGAPGAGAPAGDAPGAGVPAADAPGAGLPATDAPRPRAPRPERERGHAHDVPAPEQVVFRCGRGRDQYLADIARCQAELAAGESYEVCLTDQISTSAQPDPWELYRLLRRRNPAPFAAYLRFGEIAVVSSSPERFLSVDRERRVQARPIKGTTARRADPVEDARAREELAGDEKTYAEHLMIVDLLRNDLGRVCEVDSVRVPELMVVEPYATVHQLVSTITGVLERERTSVDCVRACFPGGSMTGAPKLRTMDIIDDVEREARGVYSGALGYFGLDGVVDLSIVIRTVVLRPGLTTIGAGGAIVMQSDPQEEFDELLLKARAPMATVARAVTGSDAPEAWTVELEPALPMVEAA